MANNKKNPKPILNNAVTLNTFEELNEGNILKSTYLDTQVKGLNLILGGAINRGLPTNTLTGFMAGPNTGKTLTAIQLAISSIAASDSPALFIDLENFFSHKGVYSKYVKPILERYSVSPNKFYLLRLNPEQLPQLFAFFGLTAKKEYKGGKLDITAGELPKQMLPKLNIYNVAQDMGFCYIAIDGYASMLKAWLGPINIGKLPSRRFLFDAVLLKLSAMVADYDMAGVATFHAIKNTSSPFGGHVLWGGFAPMFADKNLILITKANKQILKDSKTNIKKVDYRVYEVKRSMSVPEGLKVILAYKWGYGIDDIDNAEYKYTGLE